MIWVLSSIKYIIDSLLKFKLCQEVRLISGDQEHTLLAHYINNMLYKISRLIA